MLRTLIVRTLVVMLLATLLPADRATAQGWGNLKGQFVFDGRAPRAKSITPTKDVQVCGKVRLKDESLVVDRSSGGIANIVIFLRSSATGPKPPTHSSYAEILKKPATLDNLQCRFEPRMVVVHTGQTLTVKNSDPVGHNTNLQTTTNAPQNFLLPAGAKRDLSYTDPERLASIVSCNIHPWMTAWVVVRDNPYYAVTNEKGEFEIKNVPAGEWEFQFWHEKAGYVRELKIDGKAVSWNRGRAKLKFADGQTNDLGKVTVVKSIFSN